MVLLSDSDLIIKLAELDLLDIAVDALSVDRSNVRILPELRRVLGSPRVCSSHSGDGMRRAITFAEKTRTLDKIDSAEQIILHGASAKYCNRTIRIDSGEAVLYAATKFFPTFLVATGDKRSLRVLALSQDCAAIHARLKNHVICLEQIVLKLIDKHGYKDIQNRVAANCSCDYCIQNAFADGKPTMVELECRKWLDGYVRELKVDTQGLLVA
jgi:hypothetical protein